MVAVQPPRKTLALEARRPNYINKLHALRHRGKCSPYVILVWQVILDFFFLSLLVVFLKSCYIQYHSQSNIVATGLPSLIISPLWKGAFWAEIFHFFNLKIMWEIEFFHKRVCREEIGQAGKGERNRKGEKWKKMKKNENFPSWSS